MGLLSSPYLSVYVYLLLQTLKNTFFFLIFNGDVYYFLKFWRQKEKDSYFLLWQESFVMGPTRFLNEFCNISNIINKCLFFSNIIYCSWASQWITGAHCNHCELFMFSSQESPKFLILSWEQEIKKQVISTYEN